MKRLQNIVSVRISDDELELLREVGASSRKSVSELLKVAFRSYLKQYRFPEGARCHEQAGSECHEPHSG